MDIPPPPRHSFLPSNLLAKKLKEFCVSAISAIICKLVCATLAFVFAEVGIVLGATVGALVGLKNKTGFVRGVIVGATMGCILSIEVFKALRALWLSDDCSIGCFIPLIKTASNLLHERLVRDSHSPTMQVLTESQLDATVTDHNEVPKLCSKGLSRDSTEKIPKIRLAGKNIGAILWNGPSCSVCLQDFQLGEMVSILSPCRHTFHLSCMGEWFIGHNSCPLCRVKL